MSKASSHIKNVLGYAILIGFSVQILLGIVYTCCSIAGFQEFGDSYLYMKASKNFIFDEYTGILYPLFLLCIGGGAEVISAPSCILFKILQLAVAFASGYVFIKTIRKTTVFKAVFGSLSIMTIPMVLQCHTAALPLSFATSFLMLEIAFFVKCLRKEKKTLPSISLMGLFWVLQTMLLPEYALFGGAPILILVCVYLFLWIKKRQKECLYGMGILVAAFLVVGLTILGLRSNSKSDRPVKSIASMALSRFAGNCLSSTYGYWPEDLKACVDEETLLQCENYPLSRQSLLVGATEEKLGRKRARTVFLQVAKTGYQVAYRQVRHEMLVDMASYVFSPVFLQYQLKGRGPDSFSGRNVDIMKGDYPVLAGFYMDYGCWWYCIQFGIWGLWVLCEVPVVFGNKEITKNITKKIKTFWKSEKCAVTASLMAIGMCMVLWYTMQGAGMMDYKNTIFLLVGFCLIQGKGGNPT